MKLQYNVVEVTTDRNGLEFTVVESEHDTEAEAEREAERLNRDFAGHSTYGMGDSVEFIVDEVEVDDDVA